MARAGLLERRPRLARLSRRTLLTVATVLAVLAGTLAGGYLALVAYHQERQLTVGEIRMSVSPGHRGAVDIYVPLVDWGARFEAIRLPVRLRIDLETVDREVVTRVAAGHRLNVRQVRVEARNAIADYLRTLIAVVVNCAAALGLLVALAVRTRAGPKLRVTIPLALGTALSIGVLLVLLIPPRGQLENPQYYAHGPDIPRVLSAAEAAERSSGALDQELDVQLVGLARLVVKPGQRSSLAGRPQLTLASDLHNNVLALPVLEGVAAGGPLFFPGDLTDRGSPLETSLVRRVVGLGHPFVFVTGNHDSDLLAHELARAGAIVLTRRGELRKNGSYGPKVVRIAGLRVAGYDDPFERLRAQGFKDRYDSQPSPAMQQAFTNWLRPLLPKVDAVMVHEPALIAQALAELRQFPPSHPIVFLVGHTHIAALDRQPSVTILNGGSVGAGGTGNLAEHTDIGLARFIYSVKPGFDPLAADLVSVDPGTGSSTARRIRLDAPG
jgi:predicted phosphodiesterase